MIWVEIIRKTIIKRKVDLPVTLIFFFSMQYTLLKLKSQIYRFSQFACGLYVTACVCTGIEENRSKNPLMQ